MNIGKDWKIEQDSTNTTILHRRVVAREGSKNAGESQWDNAAYFSPTLGGLKDSVKFLADQEVSSTKMSDLLTVIKRQDEIYALIETLVNNPTRETPVG